METYGLTNTINHINVEHLHMINYQAYKYLTQLCPQVIPCIEDEPVRVPGGGDALVDGARRRLPSQPAPVPVQL